VSDNNFDCEKCNALCIQQGYAIKGKDCPDYPNGKAPRTQDSSGSAELTGCITCGWEPGDVDSDCYETGCGQSFVIYEGTPKENSMKFCCFCGKRISTE